MGNKKKLSAEEIKKLDQDKKKKTGEGAVILK
jgi:hypothetical protein